MSVYLTGLGDFYFEGGKQKPDDYLGWAFFFASTFLVLIVFMNMLIAIMGDTFAFVQST